MSLEDLGGDSPLFRALFASIEGIIEKVADAGSKAVDKVSEVTTSIGDKVKNVMSPSSPSLSPNIAPPSETPQIESPQLARSQTVEAPSMESQLGGNSAALSQVQEIASKFSFSSQDLGGFQSFDDLTRTATPNLVAMNRGTQGLSI